MDIERDEDLLTGPELMVNGWARIVDASITSRTFSPKDGIRQIVVRKKRIRKETTEESE
jgi:hypothetical protein